MYFFQKACKVSHAGMGFYFLLLSCAVLANGQNAEKSILSYQQYGATEHQNPYILEFKTASGMLLFYGAEHTVDPKNPQIADIGNRWAAFQPTAAYNEGGNPPTWEDLGTSVQFYGEAGLVRFLAKSYLASGS